MDHRSSASRGFVVRRSWDFSTPFEPTPLEAKYCVPTARYQAKLAATWSAMAPTGQTTVMLVNCYAHHSHTVNNGIVARGHFSLNCSWCCIQRSVWSDMHLLRKLQYQILVL